MVYKCNGILAIKKNRIMPFAATWMDLEIIILSEVSQRKTSIIWYYSFVEPNFKINDINELIYKTETYRFWKQTYGYQRGNIGGRGKLGAWDEHTNTTIYKTDNQQGLTVEHRELYSVFCRAQRTLLSIL